MGCRLLYLSENTGYLLSSADADHYTQNVWALGSDGDFKPSTGSYLANNQPFDSIDAFFSQLVAVVQKPFSIEVAIEEAKTEAERIRKRGGGESEAHKTLKRHVAENPMAIGLNGVISTFQEYAFPSGDQVDIAFESPSNHWTVVEIELQGLAQTLVGLFQSVKYKALQEAVLKSKKQEGSVDGVLVAKSIPDEVKSLAGILGIRTFEVDV